MVLELVLTSLARAACPGLLFQPTQGPVVVGRPVVVEALPLTAEGQPCDQALPIDFGEGAELLPSRGPVARARIRPEYEGLWRISTPEAEATWPVSLPEPAPWRLPQGLDLTATDELQRILLVDPSLPPADRVEVQLSEGRIEAVQATPEGLLIALKLDRNPLARVALLTVSDRRGDQAPSLVTLWVVAKPRLPLEVEPGAQVEATLSDRTYGPVVADDDGKAELRLEQRPGERAVRVRVEDDLGNGTVQDFALGVSTAGAMIGGWGPPDVEGGRLVWVVALNAEGRPVAPSCSWEGRPLPLRSDAEGRAYAWVAPGGQGRLACEARDAAWSSNVLPPLFPVAAELEVWPPEVPPHDPRVSWRASWLDAAGGRHQSGTWRLDTSGGAPATQGEGRGEVLLAEGSPQVALTARWTPAAGQGAAVIPDFTWEQAEGGPRLSPWSVDEAYGRVEPRGAEVSVRVIPESQGQPTVSVGQVRLPGGRWAGHVLVGVAEEPLARISPTRAASLLAPRTVHSVHLQVSPPSLAAGPSAVARIHVRLTDDSGRPVEGPPPELVVAQGRHAGLTQVRTGEFVADWYPQEPPGYSEVEVRIRTQDGLQASTIVGVRPQGLGLAVGPWVGLNTNFGGLTRPAGGVNFLLGTRLFDDAAQLQLSAAVHDTSLEGDDVQVRGALVPLQATLLLRRDWRRWAFFGGFGGGIGLHLVGVRFDGELQGRGVRTLVGPVATLGVSRRMGVGEWVLLSRGAAFGGGNGEVSFTGNVAGLTLGIGYHLAY